MNIGNVKHPVAVLIPVYGAADQLRLCLRSLADYLPAGCAVYVLDDATPDDSVAQVSAEFQKIISEFSYLRRPQNLGFVLNCNQGMLDALASGRDVLLLNSDTQITQGAIEELSAVLHLHEKHGAVTPRSNNATIYSIPVFGTVSAPQSYELWLKLKSLLNRYQVMPTNVGFCTLIRNSVLRDLGLFDPIFSPGYNEENDLVCRMNRYGYSAVAANRAFVFHHEGASFGGKRRELELRNREILDARYPEYSRTVDEYFRYHMDPADRFAAVWAPHRKRILYDLYHLPPLHSGTSEFGLSLLLHLAPELEDRYEIVLGLKDEARSYFETEIAGYQIFDEPRSRDVKFDLVFKPCQLFSWQELHRMARLGPRVCFTHQDSIAVRCRYLSGASLGLMHRQLPSLVDKIITISHFSKADFEAFHNVTAAFEVIYHGIHPVAQSNTPGGGYILVIGNDFQHKGVAQAVSELTGLRRIVVLGGKVQSSRENSVDWLVSGNLGRAEVSSLFENAALIVYPSYYEGFGLPIVDGLALGRHVIALDTGVSREVGELTQDPKLHLVCGNAELRSAAEQILSSLGDEAPIAADIPRRTWADVARDYAYSLTELIERDVDVNLLRYRWTWLAAMDAYSPLQ